MDRLTPVVFHDNWGSHEAIAALQGRPCPTPERESELWMGAHESGPAGTDRPGAPHLADVVAADPHGELGADCVARHGERLPFLLKVLAPGRAISIQVHPTAEQARELRRTTGDEVYVDDSAKPELLLAVEPFEVFVGMRGIDAVRETARRLRVDSFDALVGAVEGADDPPHALLEAVLATRDEASAALVREVVDACARVAAEGPDDETADLAAAVVEVARAHPDDIGLVVLLLMHHRVLAPGEYVDVAAGVLHSYVGGVGIEVLANSDNVVRVGLTSKEVNVPELLRIVDPRANGVAGRGRPVAEGVEVFDTASDCFLLHRVRPGRDLPSVPGPRLAFCLRGDVRLDSTTGSLRLRDAESVFLPAGEGPVRLDGDGEVYVVTLPGGA
ncbi:mannose-6-phosphate isomerase, class I [Phycicoccus sp. BSK3Z-2]|uniref:mannose-6-phosphate isomerase n=1 Tax=Phycicoccus avicenniae TaxID=2828860 RepID=A0A941D9V6_9MICO|nr:mannose-6-phosphate isomerase, class I [Phycicoccus avicenniae]MBR7743778.1 mannose-6-phosphate isomerase, class I [Phycicoccus avicenniae]